MAMDYNNWYIYMPALINGAIGVTGQYSVYNQYGLMQSPVLDLASDNGTARRYFNDGIYIVKIGKNTMKINSL